MAALKCSRRQWETWRAQPLTFSALVQQKGHQPLNVEFGHSVDQGLNRKLQKNTNVLPNIASSYSDYPNMLDQMVSLVLYLVA